MSAAASRTSDEEVKSDEVFDYSKKYAFLIQKSDYSKYRAALT